MKDFILTLRVMLYCSVRSVKHPCTSICDLGNPVKIDKQAPTPWWLSLAILLLGIMVWILSEWRAIPALGEPARLMVYGPIGNIFGMSNALVRQSKEKP